MGGVISTRATLNNKHHCPFSGSTLRERGGSGWEGRLLTAAFSAAACAAASAAACAAAATTAAASSAAACSAAAFSAAAWLDREASYQGEGKRTDYFSKPVNEDVARGCALAHVYFLTTPMRPEENTAWAAKERVTHLFSGCLLCRLEFGRCYLSLLLRHVFSLRRDDGRERERRERERGRESQQSSTPCVC
jgi:hypothetical protein